MSYKARLKFKEVLNKCYDEDFPELHQEIFSMSVEAKKDKEYVFWMGEVINIIPLFAENFPPETMTEIENIYEEFLDL